VRPAQSSGSQQQPRQQQPQAKPAEQQAQEQQQQQQQQQAAAPKPKAQPKPQQAEFTYLDLNLPPPVNSRVKKATYVSSSVSLAACPPEKYPECVPSRRSLAANPHRGAARQPPPSRCRRRWRSR
jgi:hypothetical protein